MTNNGGILFPIETGSDSAYNTSKASRLPSPGSFGKPGAVSTQRILKDTLYLSGSSNDQALF